MASKPRPQRGLNIPDYDCLRSKEVVAQLTSLNSMRTWRVTWMWSFLMCFSATTTPLYVLKANRQWAAPTAKSAIYICPVLECIKEIKRRFRPFHENSTGELYICSKLLAAGQNGCDDDALVCAQRDSQVGNTDDALVESDVREDLTGAGADARHRATLRRLGRVLVDFIYPFLCLFISLFIYLRMY